MNKAKSNQASPAPGWLISCLPGGHPSHYLMLCRLRKQNTQQCVSMEKLPKAFCMANHHIGDIWCNTPSLCKMFEIYSKSKIWKEEAKSYLRHRDRKKIFFKSGREIRKGNWRDWEKMIIRKKKRSILRNQKRKWRRFGKDHPSFPVDHNVPKLAKVGENFWQNISYHTHMLRKRGKKESI